MPSVCMIHFLGQASRHELNLQVVSHYLLDLVAVVREEDLLQGLLETGQVLLHCEL